eukprot:634770-Pyramimonas_sp.AAC.1
MCSPSISAHSSQVLRPTGSSAPSCPPLSAAPDPDCPAARIVKRTCHAPRHMQLHQAWLFAALTIQLPTASPAAAPGLWVIGLLDVR